MHEEEEMKSKCVD